MDPGLSYLLNYIYMDPSILMDPYKNQYIKYSILNKLKINNGTNKLIN